MKIDRLVGILTVLLQEARVTAPQLAARFEVSRRTINRDVEALCQAGIPIVTMQGSGGGIYIAEGYKLDKQVLTVEELSSIIASLKGLGSVTERTQMERTLDKLAANRSDTVISLRESIVIDLASNYKGTLTEKIGQIKAAIHDTRVISFDYYYDKGEMRRRIEPYFIVFQWTSWYVFGYCLDRQDWRMFKLARLWDLRTEEDTYDFRDIPLEKRDFSAHFTDDKTVVGLFDASAKFQLIETYGLGCYTEDPDGRLRASLFYTNEGFMVQWLLAFGDKAEILSPPDIVAEMARISKNMSAIYKQDK